MPLSDSKLTNEELVRKKIKRYAKERPRYNKYAEILKVILEKAANRYAPLAIIQARAKTVASYAEKILRKIERYRLTDSDGNPLHPVTDLCGARVVTHTLSHVKAMSRFIEEHFEIDKENSVDLAKRLRANEFGYLSVHYIVRFRRGVFPTKEIPIKIPMDVYRLNAEIQVRTLLEHTWADIEHGLLYKSNINTHKKWEREFARLAAILEDADKSFERLEAAIKDYSSNYIAYMNRQEIKKEMAIQDIVLSVAPKDVEVAHRIAKLAMCLGDWQKAIRTLRPFENLDVGPILRDLGISECKLYKKNSRRFQLGQKRIEKAIELNPTDSDALSALGGTWKKISGKKAAAQYRRAYEIVPDDPYPLGNYLEYEIAKSKNLSPVSLAKPSLINAIKKCWNQIDIGVNIPWAYYDMGKFYLLLNEPYKSLDMYAKAVQLSTSAFMIEISLNSLNKVAVVRRFLTGYEWVYKLLQLSLAAKYPKKTSKYVLQVLKKRASGHVHKPVVIVAGKCASSMQKELRKYRNILFNAFRKFKGVVISGGTTSGISGFIGDIAGKHPNTIRAIGYIPRRLPKNTRLHKRYSRVRHTKGTNFSPLESLQSWTDIIVSGIDPANVKVIGIGGGTITASEYRIALALGAKVAVLDESSGEVAKIIQDDQWNTCKNLLPLPADSTTIGTFIRYDIPKLPSGVRDTIAMAIHRQYRQDQIGNLLTEKPSTSEWSNLPENLKESNRQQADHIFEKLDSVSLTVHKVRGRGIKLLKFSDKEVEILAEMEHARWNIERILDGWKLGPEKDLNKKVSPYLAPWEKLPEDVKEWDRQTVRKIPEYLAKVGLETRRKS
ncbi:MAG: RyR domain-containing protein [Phycisphaerae bacterium]|nr:RyR domain-containing protein [Phycisphaerae bacterium]MDD5381395.1 RyR domain-containing protein [Phycisphaerae bacterium]